MNGNQNPYKAPSEAATEPDNGTKVPISRKFYSFVFAFLIASAIFIAFGFVQIGTEEWTSAAFFGAMSLFLAVSLWATSCYLVHPDRYSLCIDEIGIHERSPLSSQRFLWPDIANVSLMTVDSAKPCIAYRLRRPTMLRYASFGRFDAMHHNQYSLDQEAILDIILAQQSLYRTNSNPYRTPSEASDTNDVSQESSAKGPCVSRWRYVLSALASALFLYAGYIFITAMIAREWPFAAVSVGLSLASIPLAISDMRIRDCLTGSLVILFGVAASIAAFTAYFAMFEFAWFNDIFNNKGAGDFGLIVSVSLGFVLGASLGWLVLSYTSLPSHSRFRDYLCTPNDE